MYKGMVRKMNLTMKASDFDQEGLYSAEEGGKICFLGLLLDIPDFVTHSQEEELEERQAMGEFNCSLGST